MNNTNVFATTNRHLENFLHMHKIRFIDQRKTDDGLNQWIYIVTPAFNAVMAEYKEIYSGSFAS